MSYFRKGQNCPVLTARAARRADLRRQARNTARTHRIRVIDHHVRAVAAASRAGFPFAADYLAGLGVDVRFASAFGTACAKAYRTNHGTSPDRGGKSIVNGRVWATYRYSNPLDLIAGALAYDRTRDLVLALPGHPVSHAYAGM